MAFLFKRRGPPIHIIKGGYQPWNDRRPPKRASWTPIIVFAMVVFFLCGGLWALINWINRPQHPVANVETFLPTALSLEDVPLVITTTTPLALTPTYTPESATLTTTWTPTPTPTQTQAFVVRTSAPRVATQTPWIVVTREVVEVTSPPITIRQNIVITSPSQIQVREVTVPPLVITVAPEVITVVATVETPTPTLTQEPPPTLFGIEPIELLPPTEVSP